MRTMAATTRFRWGSVASTRSIGTGVTSFDSRASVLPFWSPGTASRAWWTEGGTISSPTAHLNTRRIRLTRALIVVRQSPDRTISCWIDLKARGPNSAAIIEP